MITVYLAAFYTTSAFLLLKTLLTSVAVNLSISKLN